MRRVYQAENMLDAQLVRDLLLHAGIAAEVHGAMLTGGIGELPADARPSVWIADPDLYQWARQVITRHERQGREPAEWECPRCGESNGAAFEICWSCGHHPAGEPE